MSLPGSPKIKRREYIILGLFVATAAVVFLGMRYAVPLAKYVIASNDISKGRYVEAAAILASLDDYKDSRNLLTECVLENKDCMEVGMVIEFGSYDGEPIEWYVAEIRVDRIMLFSRYVLTGMAYDNVSYDWETSDIREWMNGEFYESAFTEQEKEQIVFDHDNVFLMSLDILNEWGDSMPRDWWVGLDRTDEPVYWWLKGENRGEIGPGVVNPKGGYSWYGEPDVGAHGYVTVEGEGGQPGVRPCIWIEA